MSSPAELIATPKGGGALEGIGEKFSPDLYTGTGSFSVPIALPPGRNGESRLVTGRVKSSSMEAVIIQERCRWGATTL